MIQSSEVSSVENVSNLKLQEEVTTGSHERNCGRFFIIQEYLIVLALFLLGELI